MSTVKVRHSFSFQDALGTRASLDIYVNEDDGDTVANIGTEWADLGALLNAVSGGTIIGGSTSLIESGIAAGGVDKTNGRVEQNGLFDYLVPASGRHHGIAVPAYLDSLISGGRIANTGATLALTAALTGATVVGSGVMASSDWLALGGLSSISVAFREHRRQLGNRSRVVVGP